MSTPDVSSSNLPQGLREPIDGISFDAYLLVEAAALDDLPVNAVLEWAGVSVSAFEAARERWDDRISSALELDENGFVELYADLLAAALGSWPRRIAPLDEDVGAWICLLRHQLNEDGDVVAGELGLTSGDEIRLEYFWRKKMADPEIAAMAAAAWSRTLEPLPRIVVEPLQFPPRKETT